MKILVAEDDPVTRLLLFETLKDWDFTVFQAENGIQALETLREQADLQLLLIDWSMPRLDGIDLCKKLKENLDKFFYIIMLTGKIGTDNLVEAMDAGADDFISKPFLPQELNVRIRAGRRIIEQERKLSGYAQCDSLTGIWNRRMILQFLNNQWTKSTRDDSRLAILLLDIDHFKRVNDQYGHRAGDEALQHFCELVVQQIRPYDYFGRYGGEEFLLVMPMTETGDAKAVAERIREKLESSTLDLMTGETLKLSVSIGLTNKLASDQSSEDTFRRADEAVYAAKRNGRNQVCIR